MEIATASPCSAMERGSNPEIKDTSEDRLIELMVGRQIEQRYVKEQVPIGEVVLEAGADVEGLIRNCS